MKTSAILDTALGADFPNLTAAYANPALKRHASLTRMDLVQGSLQAPNFGNDAELRVAFGHDAVTKVVVDLPKFIPLNYPPTEFFAAIQEWEGVITGVEHDQFTADLIDITAGTHEVSEIAEISFEDIDPLDRHKVAEGAIFRWLIGHSRTRSGQSSRKWVIYFRENGSRRKVESPFSNLGLPARILAQRDELLNVDLSDEVDAQDSDTERYFMPESFRPEL